MAEELGRFVNSNPKAVAEILEKMLEASPPTFDLDDKLKKLIQRLWDAGLRAEAIRCADGGGVWSSKMIGSSTT
jgi:hypothetical protein